MLCAVILTIIWRVELYLITHSLTYLLTESHAYVAGGVNRRLWITVESRVHLKEFEVQETELSETLTARVTEHKDIEEKVSSFRDLTDGCHFRRGAMDLTHKNCTIFRYPVHA